jgi:hypothetical protein
MKWVNMTNMIFILGIYDLIVLSWVNMSFEGLNWVYMKLTKFFITM